MEEMVIRACWGIALQFTGRWEEFVSDLNALLHVFLMNDTAFCTGIVVKFLDPLVVDDEEAEYKVELAFSLKSVISGIVKPMGQGWQNGYYGLKVCVCHSQDVKLQLKVELLRVVLGFLWCFRWILST